MTDPRPRTNTGGGTAVYVERVPWYRRRKVKRPRMMTNRGPRPGKRRVIISGIVVVLLALIGIGAVVAYPRVGAWAIRTKVIPKLEQKLGRSVAIADIDVRLGHAELHHVTIDNSDVGVAAGSSLAIIDSVAIDFDAWASLRGNVKLGAVTVNGVHVALHRNADGSDNLRSVIEKLSAPKDANEPADAKRASIRPTSIAVRGITVDAVDDASGVHAITTDGSVTWHDGEDVKATLLGLAVTNAQGWGGSATSLTIDKPHGGRPKVTVAGGTVHLWPKLSLSGIAGTVSPDDGANQYDVDLAGGYGGVEGTLWTAKGWFAPAAQTASIDVTAARFNLDRLAEILKDSSLVDYQKTSVDASLHVELAGDRLHFGGGFHLRDLTIGHPMLADKPVRDLDISGDIAGRVDRSAREIVLERGDFVSRGLAFSITGNAALAGGITPDGSKRAARTLGVRFVVPPISCQAALDAIPKEAAPYLSGYQLEGTFDTDVTIGIDWADLDSTVLDGSVGIKHCKVTHAPTDSPVRLKDPFDHYVEVEKGEWTSIFVGPSNPDFVPLTEVSPFLPNSLITTEDSGFYSHHGFITREFKTALVSNLKNNGFTHGASSISMQLVKNVLLYREKTLSRKLQELFLTWHMENVLTKERILEIYINVIEYGPGLYGIGPAAQQYFGKSAHDLTPTESAFFSTILPSPKIRYEQFCDGKPTQWTKDKIARILVLMHDRGRLTDEEYKQAADTPLVFAKHDDETTEACLARAKHAIKNSRPTNPLKK